MKLIVTLSLALMCSALAQADNLQPGQDEMSKLVNMEGVGRAEVISKDPLAIRGKSIKEAAITIGIQGGIKWRYEQINRELNKIQTELDFIYDFQPLLIKEKMMPPIIVEANGTFGVKDDGTATSSLTAYEIIKDARIVAQQPSWRDYLSHTYQANTNLNPVLMPKDDDERTMWTEGVEAGWAEGIQIADRMAQENISRLTRDYIGGLRFHILAQQGVVSMPTLAVGDLGIHVNGQKMDINQRIFRITDHVKYQDSNKWKIISPDQVENRPIKIKADSNN